MRARYSIVALLFVLACGAEPSSEESKTAPASEPATMVNGLAPDAPLLAPLGEGLGSEIRALLRYVPSGGEFVALFDAARVLRGPVWQLGGQDIERKVKERPEVVEFTKETGFLPFQDIRGFALVLGALDTQPPPALLIVRARFDEKKMGGFLKKKKISQEEGMYFLPGGVGLAFPEREVLLLGDTLLVKAALAAGKEGASSPLRAMLDGLDPGRPFAFALRLEEETRKTLSLPEGFSGLAGAAGWLDLSSGMEARGFLRFSGEEAAQHVFEDIQRSWPEERKALKERGADLFFDDLIWELKGKDLTFHWTLPAGLAVELFKIFLSYDLAQGFLPVTPPSPESLLETP